MNENTYHTGTTRTGTKVHAVVRVFLPSQDRWMTDMACGTYRTGNYKVSVAMPVDERNAKVTCGKCRKTVGI